MPQTIPFTCPYCKLATSVAPEFVGQTGPCARCGNQVTVIQPESPGGNPQQRSSAGSGGAAVLLAMGVLGLALFCLLGAFGGVWYLARSSAIPATVAASRNNLAEIGLALHNYHGVYGTLPPAYVDDADGQPMHSWRMLISPYLSLQTNQGIIPMYGNYNWQEPWDSPTNSALGLMAPEVFQSPLDPAAIGTADTSYVVVTGPGFAFDGTKATRLTDITDGTSNTIVVLEVASTGIRWTQPVDITEALLPSLQGTQPGSIQALMADGSVRSISIQEFVSGSIRDRFTIQGGEVVPP